MVDSGRDQTGRNISHSQRYDLGAVASALARESGIRGDPLRPGMARKDTVRFR